MRTTPETHDENAWFKSSYSAAGNSECVKVAHLETGIAVHDSKNPKAGELAFTPDAWSSFVAALKRGELAPHS